MFNQQVSNAEIFVLSVNENVPHKSFFLPNWPESDKNDVSGSNNLHSSIYPIYSCLNFQI